MSQQPRIGILGFQSEPEEAGLDCVQKRASKIKGLGCAVNIGLPLALHLLLALLWLTPLPFNGVTAASAYGSAWLVTFLGLRVAARRSTAGEVWRSGVTQEGREWLSRAMPFLVNGLLLTVFGQAGVIILKLVSSAEAAAGQVKGIFSDTQLIAAHRTFKHVGFAAGLNIQTVSVEVEDGDLTWQVDSRMVGALAAVTFYF